MNVTISVVGRFYAFDLARELHRQGHLERLITTHPTFHAVKFGVPADRVASNWPIEVFSRGFHKLPQKLRDRYDARPYIVEAGDSVAARRIPEGTDLFTGFASSSLFSLHRAKVLGAVALLERSSTHIEHQHQVMLDEYARFGIAHEPLVSPRVVERELREYASADYIVNPAAHVRKTFVDRGFDPARLITIPFGVDVEEFPKGPVNEEGTFRILQVGTVSLRKGIPYLLQAFHELDLPDAELWLVGHMTDEMKPFMKKYDNGRVFYKGTYPQSELFKIYAQGTVKVMASIEEGLALVQPQAMSCGLPLICTTSTGGDEIVRDGVDGFVIAPRDVEALKDRLTLLYEDRSRCAEMGHAAAARVRDAFTWKHYGDKAVAAYQTVLAS